MKLELQISNRMTASREDEAVRLTPRQKADLNVRVGRKILLTVKNGNKLPVIVEDAFLEDLIRDDCAAFVSRRTFDTVTRDSSEPDKITLGCDPEFVFVNQDRKVLPANYWLPHKGAIGSDGPLAEFRPPPTEHEDELVENLRQLVRALPRMLGAQFGQGNVVHPEGHSCWENYALGFHIHIGAPRALVTYAAPKTKEFIRSFITALDYFVGIPALLLEDTNVRRLGSGIYGKPGDYRVSGGTIEYRTPGGFHLRHPKYAAGILGLALCVGKEIIESTAEASSGWRRLDEHSNFDHLRRRFNLPQKRDIRWALLEPNKQLAVGHIPNIVQQLHSMENFKDHAQSIRTYFKLVVDNQQFNPNLLHNW